MLAPVPAGSYHLLFVNTIPWYVYHDETFNASVASRTFVCVSQRKIPRKDVSPSLLQKKKKLTVGHPIRSKIGNDRCATGFTFQQHFVRSLKNILLFVLPFRSPFPPPASEGSPDDNNFAMTKGIGHRLVPSAHFGLFLAYAWHTGSVQNTKHCTSSSGVSIFSLLDHFSGACGM